MDRQLDLENIYGIPPCAGGDCTPPNPYRQEMPSLLPNRIPTLEQIANYHYQNPLRGAQEAIDQMMDQSSVRPMMPIAPMLQNTAPMAPSQAAPAPILPNNQPAPISGESLQYLNGFLRTQIGRAVQVEFLIGSNTLVDKTGVLLAVGANYILINELQTDDITACDFYNIKFIRFYY